MKLRKRVLNLCPAPASLRLQKPHPARMALLFPWPDKLASDAAMHNAAARKMTETISDQADAALRASLSAALGIAPARAAGFTDATAMFGALPELDSMAVAQLLTDFEDRLAIHIDDDDVDAEIFATFGTLRAFLVRKIEAAGR
jgi:acyl carrier protein